MQPISKTLLIYKTETLYPVQNNSPFPSQPPSPPNHHSLSESINLTTLGTICNWSGITQYLPVCVAVSLRITSPHFMQVLACARIFFLLGLDNILQICLYIPPFHCQWTLGCFNNLAFVTHAAMNTCVQISQVSAVSSYEYIPKSVSARPYSNSI